MISWMSDYQSVRHNLQSGEDRFARQYVLLKLASEISLQTQAALRGLLEGDRHYYFHYALIPTFVWPF